MLWAPHSDDVFTSDRSSILKSFGNFTLIRCGKGSSIVFFISLLYLTERKYLKNQKLRTIIVNSAEHEGFVKF